MIDLVGEIEEMGLREAFHCVYNSITWLLISS